MGKIKTFLNNDNFKLENCLLDVGYYKRSGVVVKTVSNSDEINNLDSFTEYVVSPIRLIAKDGFKFSEDDKDSVISFDVRYLDEMRMNTLQPPKADEVITFTLNELFTTTKTVAVDTSKLHLDTYEYFFRGIDTGKVKAIKRLDKSGNGYLISLIGEFNPKSLLIVISQHGTGGYIKNTANNTLIADIYNDSYDVEGNYLTLNKMIIKTVSSDEPKPDIPSEPSNPPEPINNPLFNSYVVNTENLVQLRNNQAIDERVIMNVVNYPIKFTEHLKDTTILNKITDTGVKAKTFENNIYETAIFKFNVPPLLEVSRVVVNLPFNHSIDLNYKEVKGTIITGKLFYEVLSGSTTLIIDNGKCNIYKTDFKIESSVPLIPVLKDSFTFPNLKSRLINEPPSLFIDCKQPVKLEQFIQGEIISVVPDITKSELDILNNLLKEGVLLNG